MSATAETESMRAMELEAASVHTLPRVGHLLRLTKPRVVSLIVFTAVNGMFLAGPGLPPLAAVVFGPLGVPLRAGAAAALHVFGGQQTDRLSGPTPALPLPRGEITA